MVIPKNFDILSDIDEVHELKTLQNTVEDLIKKWSGYLYYSGKENFLTNANLATLYLKVTDYNLKTIWELTKILEDLNGRLDSHSAHYDYLDYHKFIPAESENYNSDTCDNCGHAIGIHGLHDCQDLFEDTHDEELDSKTNEEEIVITLDRVSSLIIQFLSYLQNNQDLPYKNKFIEIFVVWEKSELGVIYQKQSGNNLSDHREILGLSE